MKRSFKRNSISRRFKEKAKEDDTIIINEEIEVEIDGNKVILEKGDKIVSEKRIDEGIYNDSIIYQGDYKGYLKELQSMLQSKKVYFSYYIDSKITFKMHDVKIVNVDTNFLYGKKGMDEVNYSFFDIESVRVVMIGDTIEVTFMFKKPYSCEIRLMLE